MDESDRDSPRIVVVGSCASGKTTLVARLQERGYDAVLVAQEHSAMRDLWMRQNPDILIALTVSLDVVRSRRNPKWLESVYIQQQHRLASAYAAADLMINTDDHGIDYMVDMAVKHIESL